MQFRVSSEHKSDTEDSGDADYVGDSDDANDSEQLKSAIRILNDLFQQDDILMPPPMNNPAGDTPYNFPRWSIMPTLKATWQKFKSLEEALGDRGIYSTDVSKEAAGSPLKALSSIQGHLERIIPNGSPILDERLLDFCGSFSKVFEGFCIIYGIDTRCASLVRHRSEERHLPVIWTELSVQSLFRERGKTEFMSLPDLSSIGLSRLPTLETMSLFVQERSGESNASLSRTTQPGSGPSLGSDSFPEVAQNEYRLVIRDLGRCLEDAAFLQHFPGGAGTLLQTTWRSFDLMEKEAKRRIDEYPDPGPTMRWKELRNRYIRSQQALEMRRLQSILRGLIPSDGIMTAGPLSRLCLAYDKLAMLFATLYAVDGKCSLLVLDKDREDFEEYRDSVSWQSKSSHLQPSRDTARRHPPFEMAAFYVASTDSIACTAGGRDSISNTFAASKSLESCTHAPV